MREQERRRVREGRREDRNHIVVIFNLVSPHLVQTTGGLFSAAVLLAPSVHASPPSAEFQHISYPKTEREIDLEIYSLQSVDGGEVNGRPGILWHRYFHLQSSQLQMGHDPRIPAKGNQKT